MVVCVVGAHRGRDLRHSLDRSLRGPGSGVGTPWTVVR